MILKGAHESLLEKNGRYVEMWHVQAGRYEEAV
jgi:ABC-type transport system involved in Fe-S cluster assembly fused permease/ATPase subunit